MLISGLCLKGNVGTEHCSVPTLQDCGVQICYHSQKEGPMGKIFRLVLLLFFCVTLSQNSAAFLPGKLVNGAVFGLDGSPDEEMWDMTLQYYYGFYSLLSLQVRCGTGYLFSPETFYARFGLAAGVMQFLLIGELTQTLSERTTTAFNPGLSWLINRHVELYLGYHLHLYHRVENPDYLALGLRYIY